MFRAALDAVVVMDSAGIVRDWNPAAVSLFGYPREVALGQELAQLIIPAAMRDAHRHGLRRYLETGERSILDRRVELVAVRADGAELPVEVSITRIPEAEPPLFAGFVRDISRRDVAQLENARMQARMTFLAQAGLVLDQSLEIERTLKSLAELTVPELAQLTVIDLLEERVIRSCVTAAIRPEPARAVEAVRREHPLDLDSPHPVVEVIRSRQPILLPSMSAAFLSSIAQGEAHFAVMRDLGYHSAIVVPLVARRRMLGTLSLLRMHDAVPFDENDLLLAEELARRAALAVDNARLHEASVHLARTLQESLLPRRLPEIPGMEMAARYRAAAEGQEVGGDFYDVFAAAPGRWAVAIGDVCGKGPEAAALTALARFTLRAYGELPPGEVLSRLNQAILRDQEGSASRYLTAVFAQLTVEGERVSVEIASGGHPPPLVLRADGTVEPVAARGTLLGVVETVELEMASVALDPGDSLILYTDGLTDARAPEKILQEEDLARLLADGPAGDPEATARALEERATAGQEPRDDTALLVLTRHARATPVASARPRGHHRGAGRR